MESINSLVDEKERYYNTLLKIRKAICNIPLFCTPEEEIAAHKKAVQEINEILEEVGI